MKSYLDRATELQEKAEQSGCGCCCNLPCRHLTKLITEALQAVREETLEEAAKVAKKRSDTFSSQENPDFRDGEFLTACEIARDILELKSNPMEGRA